VPLSAKRAALLKESAWMADIDNDVGAIRAQCNVFAIDIEQKRSRYTIIASRLRFRL
jgi:hypothetical protein